MADETTRTWQVVDQRVTTEVTPSGQFRDVWEVMIETVDGVTFPIRVPTTEYSAERVAAEAEVRAAEVSRVANL